MKNIHILPTDKPSKLWFNLKGKLVVDTVNCLYEDIQCQNIYITSDEEIKEGVDQWYLDKVLNEPYNSGGAQYASKQDVIILTTDQDLIKDGVQAIDDEFLEWFVKNPSCEYIKTEKWLDDEGAVFYSREIPKEEPKDKCCEDVTGFYLGTTCPKCNKPFRSIVKKPKQETLEEAAERLYSNGCDGTDRSAEIYRRIFIDGAKWQQEQIGKSEFLQRLRGTLSDAEARRLIFETFNK